MGQKFSSQTKENLGDSDYVCMVLRRYNKIRILLASDEVINLVSNIVRGLSKGQFMEGVYKYGGVQFRLQGCPFAIQVGPESLTVGRIFAKRVFEEMHQLGYDLVISSDLSRMFDKGTWFFRKNLINGKRINKSPILCIAPGGMDKLLVLAAPEQIVDVIRETICEAWPQGLQSERIDNVRGESVYEFKLNGFPWHSQGDEANQSRQLMTELVSCMANHKWKLLTTTNLGGGGADVFYFQYDGETSRLSYEENRFSIIYFNRFDRLTLLNFDIKIKRVINTAITNHYQRTSPATRDLSKGIEFRLEGLPFATGGIGSVKTRRLLCHILEALAQEGWMCFASFDISRKMSDKATLVFQPCQPCIYKFACLSFHEVDKIRLINFPAQTCHILQDWIYQTYAPGIKSTRFCDNYCFEMKLKGFPWTKSSTYNLQARAMLTHFLAGIESLGWHLVISADISAKYRRQKNGPDYPIDVHSWYFSYPALSNDSI